MKVKGVSTLEQHVEKIVLVVFSFIFLVVLTLQFLWKPNMVTVGKGAPVAPEDAFQRVAEKATEVQGKMERLSDDSLEKLAPAGTRTSDADLGGQFRKRLESDTAPRRSIIPLGVASRIGGDGAGELVKPGRTGEGSAIAEIVVPAPSRATAASFWSTLDPGEVVSVPGLKALAPAEQPFDKAAVSAEFRFNGRAFQDSLMRDPDGDAGPIRAVPSNWWRGSVEILEVRLERQEQGENGQWGEASAVPAMPGRPNLMERLSEGSKGKVDVPQVLQEARRLAPEIRRPAYYRTIAGPAWTPPSEAMPAKEAAKARNPDVDRLLKQREDHTKKIDAAKKALEKLGQAPTPPGGGGGGGRSTGGGGQGGPDPRDEQRKKQERDRWERQIKDAEAAIRKIDDQLRQMGETVPGEAAEAPGSTPGSASKSADTDAKPLLETPDVRLWAHDVTATPGKTYRYRARVVVNNPAFGKQQAMGKGQEKLADSPVLVSEASEWSDPVSVLSDQYYFITSAKESDVVSGTGAAAEMYRMYYGYFRKGTTSLSPGDVIETEIGPNQLPDPNLMPIYDLSGLKSGGGEPGAARPAPRDESGGGGRRQSGEGGGAPDRDRGSKPDAELPKDAQPGPTSISVTSDSVLLDVASVPVATEGFAARDTRFQAFVRLGSGKVAVRYPEVDRASDAYKRVAASAREGESQGQPAAPRAGEPGAPSGPGQQPEPGRERPGGKKPPEPKPEGEGGGGGGGGG